MRFACRLLFAWCAGAGVSAQADQGAAGAGLDTKLVCSLEKAWDDKGSGADLDGFFYLPVVEPPYFIIGGYGSRVKELADADCVLAVKDSPQLAAPADWELIWKDKGSGARLDGSMWRAIPPGDEHRCLGSIPQAGYEKPTLSNYRCVPAGLTEKVVTSALLWTDKGSGAKKPVTMFKLPHTGSFVALPGRAALAETYDLARAAPEAETPAGAAQPLPSGAPEGAAVTAGADPAGAQPDASATAPSVSAEPPGDQTFAGKALALRRAAVDRDATAMRLVGLLPGAGWLLPPDAPEAERDIILKQTWGPFFENAIVETRAAESPGPEALYYNPLLDMALLTRWERAGSGAYRVNDLRALPGERLGVAGAATPVAPAWMAGGAPVETLHETTRQRLATFRSGRAAAHTGSADERHARAVEDLRAAQPRLEWNARQRAGWHGEGYGWLAGSIAVMEETFASGDGAALLARAADTDAETANALAGLPAGLVERLTLDMVLEYGEEERLLVVSLPDDGEVYILAQCRLAPDAGLCRTGRYLLVDLGGENGQETGEPAQAR